MSDLKKRASQLANLFLRFNAFFLWTLEKLSVNIAHEITFVIAERYEQVIENGVQRIDRSQRARWLYEQCRVPFINVLIVLQSFISISETTYRILMKFWNLLMNETRKLMPFEV